MAFQNFIFPVIPEIPVRFRELNSEILEVPERLEEFLDVPERLQQFLDVPERLQQFLDVPERLQEFLDVPWRLQDFNLMISDLAEETVEFGLRNLRFRYLLKKPFLFSFCLKFKLASQRKHKILISRLSAWDLS